MRAESSFSSTFTAAAAGVRSNCWNAKKDGEQRYPSKVQLKCLR